MEKTQRKKIIIIFVYLFIFSFLFFCIYYFSRSNENCFDKIKNQNEEEIDCGGICQKRCEKITAENLVIGKMGAVQSGVAGKYDFYAEVNNPNTLFGSRIFNYTLNFKNSSGEIIASKNGSNFILPGEKKYIIENGIDSSVGPVLFDFNIINSDWVKFSDYYEKPNTYIVNKNYNQISNGVGFFEATGLLKNESYYDFDLIKIQVILKDKNNEVLALNSTQIKTVKASENRDFKVFWPSSFPGDVENMETQAEINIFNSETFLKRYYKSHEFQQY